jgi:hypothetical protein
VRPEELDKLKKFTRLIGSRTRDLPAYRVCLYHYATACPHCNGIIIYFTQAVTESTRIQQILVLNVGGNINDPKAFFF